MLDRNFKRPLIAGDTHGDSEHFNRLFQAAKKNKCDVIVQLGDFGYWEHEFKGKRFLEVLSRWAVKSGIPIVWIDGNHENHEWLVKYVQSWRIACHLSRTDPGPFVQIREGIYYAPRGTRWSWSEVKFMGLGGAFSVDKYGREEGRSWWPGEELTEADIHYACDGPTVDVLFTHDAPWGAYAYVDHRKTADGLAHFAQAAGIPRLKFADMVNANRHRVRAVIDAVRPRIVFHGHLHMRDTDSINLDDGFIVEVEAVDANINIVGSALVLDLPTLERTEAFPAPNYPTEDEFGRPIKGY